MWLIVFSAVSVTFTSLLVLISLGNVLDGRFISRLIPIIFLKEGKYNKLVFVLAETKRHKLRL